MSRAKKLLTLAAHALLFAFFFIWLSKNIDAGTLRTHVSLISVWAVLGSLVINLCALAAYGFRMSLMLGESFRTGFVAVNIGYALNTILPLRLGEAAKILVIHRLYSIPVANLSAATVVEKLLDLLKIVLLGLIVATISVQEFVDRRVLIATVVLISISIAVLLFLRLLASHNNAPLARLGWAGRFLLEALEHGSRYSIRYLICMSVFIWMLNVLLTYFVFNNYLPALRFSILDAATILVIIALATAIPSAPAGIGLFEAGIIAYLTQIHGVQNEAALAIAIVFHLVITVPQLLVFGIMSLLPRARAAIWRGRG